MGLWAGTCSIACKINFGLFGGRLCEILLFLRILCVVSTGAGKAEGLVWRCYSFFIPEGRVKPVVPRDFLKSTMIFVAVSGSSARVNTSKSSGEM